MLIVRLKLFYIRDFLAMTFYKCYTVRVNQHKSKC